MAIRKSRLVELLGFILIIVGFILMILNDAWDNNPIPNITEKNMYFSSIGLIIWALSYQSRKSEEEQEK